MAWHTVTEEQECRDAHCVSRSDDEVVSGVEARAGAIPVGAQAREPIDELLGERLVLRLEPERIDDEGLRITIINIVVSSQRAKANGTAERERSRRREVRRS